MTDVHRRNTELVKFFIIGLFLILVFFYGMRDVVDFFYGGEPSMTFFLTIDNATIDEASFMCFPGYGGDWHLAKSTDKRSRYVEKVPGNTTLVRVYEAEGLEHLIVIKKGTLYFSDRIEVGEHEAKYDLEKMSFSTPAWPKKESVQGDLLRFLPAFLLIPNTFLVFVFLKRGKVKRSANGILLVLCCITICLGLIDLFELGEILRF